MRSNTLFAEIEMGAAVGWIPGPMQGYLYRLVSFVQRSSVVQLLKSTCTLPSEVHIVAVEIMQHTYGLLCGGGIKLVNDTKF